MRKPSLFTLRRLRRLLSLGDVKKLLPTFYRKQVVTIETYRGGVEFAETAQSRILCLPLSVLCASAVNSILETGTLFLGAR